jgi:hypothetical protein
MLLQEVFRGEKRDARVKKWDAFSMKLLKKSFSLGCSKMPGCMALEILRNEAYLAERRNDDG